MTKGLNHAPCLSLLFGQKYLNTKCIFNISCKTEIFGVSAHLMQSENLSDLHEMGEDTLINVVCV